MKRHGNSLCPYKCETPRRIFQGIILRVMISPPKPNNPETPWDWLGHELAGETPSCELVPHGTRNTDASKPHAERKFKKNPNTTILEVVAKMISEVICLTALFQGLFS